MKPSSLLPVSLVCFLSASLLIPAPLRAADDDQAAHKAAAEEVVKATHIDATVTAASDHLMTMVDNFSDLQTKALAGKPEAAEFKTRMHTRANEMLQKQLDWTALKPEIVRSYADNFSTQELKDLTGFYNTPLGQKLASKQPEISDLLGKAMQIRLQRVMPMVISMVRGEAAKIPGNTPPTPSFPGNAPGPLAVPPAPPGGMGQLPVPPAPPALGKLPPPPPAFVPPPAPPAPPAADATPAVNPAPKATP